MQNAFVKKKELWLSSLAEDCKLLNSDCSANVGNESKGVFGSTL